MKVSNFTKIPTLPVNCVDKVLEREDFDNSHTLNTLSPEFKPQFPDHLQCIDEKVPNEITPEQKQKLQNPLIEYQNSFSTTSTDMVLLILLNTKLILGMSLQLNNPPEDYP